MHQILIFSITGETWCICLRVKCLWLDFLRIFNSATTSLIWFGRGLTLLGIATYSTVSRNHSIVHEMTEFRVKVSSRFVVTHRLLDRCSVDFLNGPSDKRECRPYQRYGTNSLERHIVEQELSWFSPWIWLSEPNEIVSWKGSENACCVMENGAIE